MSIADQDGILPLRSRGVGTGHDDNWTRRDTHLRRSEDSDRHCNSDPLGMRRRRHTQPKVEGARPGTPQRCLDRCIGWVRDIDLHSHSPLSRIRRRNDRTGNRGQTDIVRPLLLHLSKNKSVPLRSHGRRTRGRGNRGQMHRLGNSSDHRKIGYIGFRQDRVNRTRRPWCIDRLRRSQSRNLHSACIGRPVGPAPPDDRTRRFFQRYTPDPRNKLARLNRSGRSDPNCTWPTDSRRPLHMGCPLLPGPESRRLPADCGTNRVRFRRNRLPKCIAAHTD